MNEVLIGKFAESLYESVVEENLGLYKDLFEKRAIDFQTEETETEAIDLYNGLTDEKRVILIKIIEQTMIDTVSTVLGIIDGHVTQVDNSIEPKLLLNSEDTHGVLQDFFLAYIEEQEDNN